MADATYNAEVYFKQGSTELVVAKNGKLNIESSGEIVNQNVVNSTAASTGLTNFGLTVVNCTLNQQLVAPALGCIKEVLFVGTTGKKMRLKTGSTAIFFNSSDGKDHIIEVTPETSKVSNHGLRMELRGGSTTQWWVGGGFGSTVQWTVDFKASS